MLATSDSLPCIGNSQLYDIVLFEEAPSDQRTQAVHRAAGLCAGCPSPCEQKVTVDTTPRELVLLDPDWLPPSREGVLEPEVPKFGKGRTRQPELQIGQDYVRPAQRVNAWARMAAERANIGHRVADIAIDLCVDEATATALIALGQQQARGVA